MQEERYRVVLSGELDRKKTPKEIEAALATQFKLSPSILKRVMAGRPIVVKSGLNVEMAFMYKSRIDALGVFCRIERVPETSDTDAQGYVERRKSSRRDNNNNDRRKTRRASSIQPDRRVRDRRRNGT